MNHFDIIIVGGGFGGLTVAQGLIKSKKKVLLIEMTNFHLFQPLLYQVATASLAEADISVPIRELLKKATNIVTIMDEVNCINRNKKQVITQKGLCFSYDKIVIASGTRHSYFGHHEWEKYAKGLKSLNDAIAIKNQLLSSLEDAELFASQNQDILDDLNYVIVGGGPTGVEMAGAISEMIHNTMAKNFRYINHKMVKVVIIEAANRLLGQFSEKLSTRAKKDLEKSGVEIFLDEKVVDVKEKSIETNKRRLKTRCIIWAAGNQCSQILLTLNTPLDKNNRVFVNEHINIPDDNDVFVIGDAAALKVDNKFLPAQAPVAIQQGKYVISRLISNNQKGFKYFNMGQMATIRKNSAIAEIANFEISGMLAWLIWSIVHINSIVLFKSKISILLSWIIQYINSRRYYRIIN